MDTDLPTELLQKLKPAKILKIMKDPVKSARAVNLRYTNDQLSEGIRRRRRGKNFQYYLGDEKIKEKHQLARIRKLAIPPAWENVWICEDDSGHLQATGLDTKQRKQYRYHPVWNALRNQTKFYRMLAFGNALPGIRLQLEKDLARPTLDKQKVLAVIVSLMERTNIRVGNSIYEKLYGSFGLTTLKDRHIQVQGDKVKFSFKGKKGVYHDIDLKSRKLARAVQKCKDIPGKELFQYYDKEGNRHSIDSGMVNQYIKELSGEDFTAKDFRTWSGTVNAFIALRELGDFENKKELKSKVKDALDIVAGRLRNTSTVCRKYYVHPLLLNLYETKGINKYFAELDQIEINDGTAGLTVEEKMVMAILEKEKMVLENETVKTPKTKKTRGRKTTNAKKGNFKRKN